MQNLDKRIYGLLEQNKHSISISKIVNLLKDVERQDVTKELQNLKKQGLIIRKVKEGKAFYSINPENEEDGNGTWENINNIDFDLTKLTYDKNILFENDSYKMGIPDSFKYLTNEDERDFVAYLPNENEKDLSYDEGGAYITIYSSTTIPMASDTKKIAEVKNLLYDYIFYNGGYIMYEKYGGKPEYKVVDLACGRTGVIYMRFDDVHNFYFVVCLKNNFQQMRIVIDSINGSKDYLEKIAISIMNKFTVKEDLNDFLELNDKKYLVKNIDKTLIAEWVDNIKGIHSSLDEYFQIFVKLESTKMTVMKSKGSFNIIEFKKEIKEGLKNNVNLLEKHLKNAEQFINHTKNNNVNIEIMIPAYYSLKQLLSIKDFSINVEDGTTIVEKSDLSEKIENSLFDSNIMKKIASYKDDDYSFSSTDDNKKELNKMNNELKEICDDFLKQARRTLKRFRRDWDTTKEEYTDGLSSKTILSEYELKWELKNIKQVARTYGDQYEDFLIELDKEGKKILKQGGNYLFIDEINKIIKETFDAFSDLYLSFRTVGTAYMDLGTYDYEISDEVNDIKYWWQNEYDNNPDVKMIKEEKEQAANQKRKILEAKIRAQLGKIENELIAERKFWSEETNKIKNKLTADKKKIKDKYQLSQDEQLNKLTNDRKDIISDLKKSIDNLTDDNYKCEKEISSLGMLKFIQKDKLKQQIDINNQNIEKYKEQIKKVDDDYKKENEKIILKTINESTSEIEKLERKYKLPEEPENVFKKLTEILSPKNIDNSSSVSENKELDNQITKEIYETLANLARPVTIIDLQSENRKLAEYSNLKLSTLLSKLVESKRVVKTSEAKRTYYSIDIDDYTYDNDTSDNSDFKELVDKDLDNTYSKDRVKIFEILNSTKSFDVDSKKEYKEIKNLSDLRIYQILFSLEQDGLVQKTLKDNKIIFKLK